MASPLRERIDVAGFDEAHRLRWPRGTANLGISAGANVGVEADADMLLKGATVSIEGGTILLTGPVHIQGNLTVSGTVKHG